MRSHLLSASDLSREDAIAVLDTAAELVIRDVFDLL